MRERKPKHVIFLGAGASATSGYPVADTLRLEWLASADVLRERVMAEMKHVDASRCGELMRGFEQWLEPTKQSLRLFREGGFGTIDEFCYHIRDARPDAVGRLKQVLRLVFGMHRPEAQFAKSDYYRFVQRLFNPGKLSELRDDVVVMSFNYDPYLDWLLRRALYRRRHALGDGRVQVDSAAIRAEATVTSGFSYGKSGLTALAQDDSFCLLKLHGTSVWPYRGSETRDAMVPECCFDRFFHEDTSIRLDYLTAKSGGTEVPIVFPWEIMSDSSSLHTSESFRIKDPLFDFREGWRIGGREHFDPTVHEIFTAIWTRAKEEVQAAKKISFVGLSMHEYLNFGFRFLLQGKTGEIELVVTDDKGRQRVGGYALKEQLSALSPGARVLRLLGQYCPNLRFNIGARVSGIGNSPKGYRSIGEAIRLRMNFEDFIWEELS